MHSKRLNAWLFAVTNTPQALERTHALGNSRALESFVHEQLNLHRGQGRDILWRDTNRCPTEEEYEAMVLDSECIYRPLFAFNLSWGWLFGMFLGGHKTIRSI